MSKRYKADKPIPPNFVAKHAHRFNKTQTFRDRTGYRRKAKHPGREPLPMNFLGFIGKGFHLPTETIMRFFAHT